MGHFQEKVYRNLDAALQKSAEETMNTLNSLHYLVCFIKLSKFCVAGKRLREKEIILYSNFCWVSVKLVCDTGIVHGM